MLKSRFILTSLFLSLLAFPSAVKSQQLDELIGMKHPPLPYGIKNISGWLISDPYSIKRVLINGKNGLLLNLVLEEEDQNAPYLKILDVVILPELASDDNVMGDCFVNGKHTPDTVVIVKLEDEYTRYLTRVSKAWKAGNGKFQEISIQGLSFECENLGYGM